MKVFVYYAVVLLVVSSYFCPYFITASQAFIKYYSIERQFYSYYVVINKTKHIIQREEIYRYNIEGKAKEIDERKLKSFQNGIEYRFVALNGTTLVQRKVSDEIFLLYNNTLRYIYEKDAYNLIQQGKRLSYYQGPVEIKQISDIDLQRYPIGRPFNELSIYEDSTTHYTSSKNLIISNTQINFYRRVFNPSLAYYFDEVANQRYYLLSNRDFQKDSRYTQLFLVKNLNRTISLDSMSFLQIRWKIDDQIYCDEFKGSEDARLFRIGKFIYIITTNTYRYNVLMPWKNRRKYFMIMARIHYDKNGFFIDSKQLIIFDTTLITSGKHTNQKNWSPFMFDNKIYISYSINPHIILNFSHNPLQDTTMSTNTYTTTTITTNNKRNDRHVNTLMKYDILSINNKKKRFQYVKKHLLPSIYNVNILHSTLFNASLWVSKYGDIRGGTPGIVYNNTHNIAAFHSSYYIKVGDFTWHTYAMGLYLYENIPPFAIKAISATPIGSDVFYSGDPSQLYKELAYCIFPMSIFIKDQEQATMLTAMSHTVASTEQVLEILYGRNNEEAWLVTLDLNKAIATLKLV